MGQPKIRSNRIQNLIFFQIENAVDSGIREAEEIVGSEIEAVKQEEEVSTEKLEISNDVEEKEESSTSPKSSNVEWSADDQSAPETSTGESSVAAIA